MGTNQPPKQQAINQAIEYIRNEPDGVCIEVSTPKFVATIWYDRDVGYVANKRERDPDTEEGLVVQKTTTNVPKEELAERVGNLTHATLNIITHGEAATFNLGDGNE